MTEVNLLHGDCLNILKGLPEGSVDCVITDPPYGLTQAGTQQIKDCLTSWAGGEDWNAKGEGYMRKAWDSWVPSPSVWIEVSRVLKEGGHLLVFAGARTQDLMSISMRLAGLEIRDSLMWLHGNGFPKSQSISRGLRERGHTTCAEKWEGWGTALKPAYEPIILARKPFKSVSSVVENVRQHGTGALNIDSSRLEDGGRYPSNLLLDPVASLYLDEQEGRSVSRFFYCAKASRKEKDAGLESRESLTVSDGRSTVNDTAYQRGATMRKNPHPTVKPIQLMRYLVRLITPPEGVVLDPFMGSGTTGCACVLEGERFMGIELDPTYFAVAQERISHFLHEPDAESLSSYEDLPLLSGSAK